MAAFRRLAVNLGKSVIFKEPRRCVSLSPITRLKEITETREGKSLIIEAKILPSPRESRLLKTGDDGSCPVCSSGLDIKHTDVMILSQFVRSDGCMLPRRITGLCQTQQKRISTMVTMAQKAGLMPNLNPANSKRDPKQRRMWKKFNTYFDEDTIKARYF